MKQNTKKLVFASMLIAISIVFTRLLSVQVLPTLRYSLGWIPIFVAGLLLGPIWGGAVGALADFIGFMLSPMGTFFPGYTLSSALAGALPPLILKLSARKPVYTWYHILLALSMSELITAVGLKSLWAYIYFTKAIHLALTANIINYVIMLPINVFITWKVYRSIIKAQPLSFS